MLTKQEILSTSGRLIYKNKKAKTAAELVLLAISAGANLSGANLSGADLRSAYLRSANLSGAYLRSADLSGADLSGADLRSAYLSGANLSGADLRSAYLRSAYLRSADLSGADLSGANLSGANLSGADLRSADLSGTRGLHFQIPQEGSLVVWKKLRNNVICKLLVPSEARRTATPVGRKCRAEFVEVLEGAGIDMHRGRTQYIPGQIVKPDKYDGDIRLECTNGIHFFLTREEAEEY